MRRVFRPVLVPLVAATLLAAAPGGPLPGFTAESARAEREWENRFRAVPSPDSLRAYTRLLSARPHHVGSPYDKDNAEWLRARLASWGWDAKHRAVRRALPHAARTRLLELVAPTKFTREAPRSRPSRAIPRAPSARSSSPPTTPTRSTATSPRRWST